MEGYPSLRSKLSFLSIEIKNFQVWVSNFFEEKMYLATKVGQLESISIISHIPS
jgi:hypothetical protein